MPSPVRPPHHSRPRAVARPAPRAALRPVPAAPAVNPEEDSTSSRQPLIYWPVVGALAGLCVVLLMLLALVLRSDRPRPAAPAVAQAAHKEAGDPPDADADRSPAHRDPPPPETSSPPPQQHADAPALPTPPDGDPPDDGSPAPPPPTTGLPVLLAPRSGECPAPAPGEAPGCGHYGTAVNFVDDPAEAARQALRGKKLLFVLHVAGNFEDSHFT